MKRPKKVAWRVFTGLPSNFNELLRKNTATGFGGVHTVMMLRKFCTAWIVTAVAAVVAGVGTSAAEDAVAPNLSIARTADSQPVYRLTLQGTLNSVEYNVYRSTALPSGTWTLVGTVMGSDAPVTFDDNSIGNAAAGFYHVVAPSPLPAIIPRTGWTVSVDSEELNTGPNGEPATPGRNAIDGDPNTFWHTEWILNQPDHPHQITIDMQSVYSVSGFRHIPRQDNVPNGRIADFDFYVSLDGSDWGAPVATGPLPDTASETQIVFTPKMGRFVKLVAHTSYPNVFVTSLAELNVLSDRVPNGTIDLPVEQTVSITAGDSVQFSGSATDPDNSTPFTYLWTFGGSGVSNSALAAPGALQFNNPGTFNVSLSVTNARGLTDPVPAKRTIIVNPPVDSLIPQAGWQFRSTDSQELNDPAGSGAGPASNAFDGDPNTFWQTQWVNCDDPSGPAPANPCPGHPHEIQIDLGAVYGVSGFHHLPRQDGVPNGRIAGYEFYVSSDGNTWQLAATGTLPDTDAETEVLFAPVMGQYIRLVATSSHPDNFLTSLAELNVLMRNSPRPAQTGSTTPKKLPRRTIRHPKAQLSSIGQH